MTADTQPPAPPDDVLAFWRETYTTAGVALLMDRWAKADEYDRERMCLFARIDPMGS